jgi:hypothetical protein
MRRILVVGFVLAALALVVAASFAIPVGQGKHADRTLRAKRVPAGEKSISERTSGTPVGEEQLFPWGKA